MDQNNTGSNNGNQGQGGQWNGGAPGWNGGAPGWNGGGGGGGNGGNWGPPPGWGNYGGYQGGGGNGGWNEGGWGNGQRQTVRCFNCGQSGHYARECPMRRQGGGFYQGGGGEGGGGGGFGMGNALGGRPSNGVRATAPAVQAATPTVALSKELEESFGAMTTFFKLSLDEKNKVEAAKKEEEDRRKEEGARRKQLELEKIEKEDAKRIEQEKKQDKAKKEVDRLWDIRKMFGEQRVFLRKEVKKAVNEEITDMVKSGGKKLTGDDDEWEEWPEDEEEDHEAEEEDHMNRRRKRAPTQQGGTESSPPVETPPKSARGGTSRQPVFAVVSPVEPERKTRGRPKRKETQSLILDPWAGAFCSVDFNSKISYKVAIVRYLGNKVCPELKMMYRKEGIEWRARKDEAVEELAELRVMQSVFEVASVPGGRVPRVSEPEIRVAIVADHKERAGGVE
ncbi:hypothetical protein CBR_g13071 [Chara braunii]|uniref:CCHC-type domain-containing protein n=1 Tax=Chara braunii TaxID=69332 RepID=A0A388KTL8_CHABU|nr:hypothetical protein CBR_g13071 [Chara braunii]|eukprot:GBG73352.1 hypothetical protein CBR_g13071 [Chara braunii]